MYAVSLTYSYFSAAQNFVLEALAAAFIKTSLILAGLLIISLQASPLSKFGCLEGNFDKLKINKTTTGINNDNNIPKFI